MKLDAAQATEIAIEYARKSGQAFSKVEKAEFDEITRVWNISLDVGAVYQKIKTVVVDDESGKVVSFR